MPQLRQHAALTLCIFGNTYLCEKLLSLMKVNKASHRSLLSNEHLESILKISTTSDLTTNELVAKKDGDHSVLVIRHKSKEN